MSFESPAGALVALAALVPLAALAVGLLRAERLAARLGLRRAGRRHAVPAAALTALALLLLGLAAAQPTLRRTHDRAVRTESQVFFVVDVSRSMAAAPRAGGRSRLDRARAIVTRLRAAAPDVPSGLAGLTDRVLPYLFPTADRGVFAETLRRSVTLESPPPQRVSTNATSFGALAALGRNGFFASSARHRACVLVSDGETASFSSAAVARALEGPRGCRLIVVRVGSGDERVFGARGVPEAGYAPDPAATGKAEALAAATGGRAFAADEAGAAAQALRSAVRVGPVRAEGREPTTRRLAPYAAAFALVATVAVVAVRRRRFALRRARAHA